MAAGTPEVHAVQAARVFVESTFGADSSASIASYTYVPFREGTLTMTLSEQEQDSLELKTHIDDGRKRVLGKRSATLAGTTNLSPTGTAAVTGTSAITSALGILLKAVMGGETLAAGSTSSTGSTAIVVNVQSGHGTRWAVGGVLGWANASGVVEWREIESISTDAITLKHGFSGAPSSTNAIYNAATYYMTANPSTSLAFLVEGLVSTDRWLLTGGQGTFTIALDITGNIPTIAWTFTFANWYASNETGSSITGTLATATYSAYNPIVGEAGMARLFTVGAATLTTSSILYCSAIGFTPHIAFVPYTAPQGVETVVRWVKTRNTDGPLDGQFTITWQDTSFFAAREARTSYDLNYTFGVAAGAAVTICARTIQLLNPQRAPDASGLAAQVIMFKGRREDDTGVVATTDQAKSPLTLHIG